MSERISILGEYREKRAAQALAQDSIEKLGGGDDNGGMGDIPYRVGVLEGKMDKVQDTLISIQVTLARIEERMATKDEIRRVEVDVAELKGRVAKLPSLAQIAALIAVAGAILKGLALLHI